MKFDYTKGQTARYMVSVYRELVSDQYYFHYYADAKKLFDDIVKKEKGAIISIYDMIYDIRKNFIKV